MLKRLSSCTGQYIFEAAIVLPVTITFVLGCIDIFDIFRAYGALKEAAHLTVRNIVTANGPGVQINSGDKKFLYNWVEYKWNGSKLNKTIVAYNSPTAPRSCYNGSASCSAIYKGTSSGSANLSRFLDFNKAFNNFGKKELASSSLPKMRFDCSNTGDLTGCLVVTPYYHAPVPEKGKINFEQFEVQLTYYMPLKFTGGLMRIPHIKISAGAVETLETDFIKSNPLIITENINYK